MDEIPEDIREKASSTANDIHQRLPHDHVYIIARTLLAERQSATAEERERCAKIGDARWATYRETADRLFELPHDDAEGWSKEASCKAEEAKNYAAAIRGGSHDRS